MIRREPGATPRGERVLARARKIVRKAPEFRHGVRYLRALFEQNAQCILERLLVLDGKPIESAAVPAGIAGERILTVARKHRRVRIRKGSSTHKIQEMRLEGDVFCVVEKPLIGLHLGSG